MFGQDLNGARDWVRSWADQMSARAEAARQMATQVATLSSTAEGAGGAVKVTVDASGLITEFDLADSTRSMSGADLAKEIMDTVRRAQAGLTAKVGAVVAVTVGADTETGSAVIGSFERRFPEPAERDGEEHRQGRHE